MGENTKENDTNVKLNTNSETILFIRKPKSRADRRIIEKEYNNTFPRYKRLEENFSKALFSIENTDEEYKALYDFYNKAWKKLCDYNYQNKRHLHTLPNKLYFELRYMPLEQETKKSIFKRITEAIQKKAGEVKFIEK
jgi:hypothetical protein